MTYIRTFFFRLAGQKVFHRMIVPDKKGSEAALKSLQAFSGLGIGKEKLLKKKKERFLDLKNLWVN